MRDKLVSEPIDERILRLLGLKEVFDLDYETYKNLLGELVISSTLGKSVLSREEELLIQQEFKRIKRKKGRFKPKKITAKSVATTKITGQKLLPGVKQSGMMTVFVGTIQSIQKSVESISKSLTEQNKLVEKNTEEERKRKESEKRLKKEESLEKGAKRIASIAQKMFAPVKGILDQIFNYLFYTFLGTAFTAAFDWFANPANKKKVDTLVRFVKDWWPSILGAAALFLTPFGAFIRTTLSLVGGFAKQIATKILPGLARFAISNPLVTAGAVTGVAAAVGTARERGEIEKIAKQQGTQAPKFGGGSVWETIGQSFNLIGSGLQGVSGGGLIDSSTGARISGAGPDTQLTALQPGEFVINRAAVKAIGVNKLMQLNAMHGGSNANKPKFAGSVQFAQSGGLVGYSKDQVKAYLDMYGMAKKAGATFPQLTASMAMHETGWMKHISGNNAFNQRDTNGNFKSYKTVQDSVNHWVRLWDKKRPGMKNISEYKDPNSAFAGIVNEYAPPSENDPGAYKKSVARIMNDMKKLQPSTTAAKARIPNKQTGILQNILGIIGIPPITGTAAPAPANTIKIPQRFGAQSRELPSLLPSSRVKTSIITMPPSFETASGMVGKKAGTEIPSFSAIAPGNKRNKQAEIYGLVG